jgi:HK97 family phage portal protein
MRLLTRIGRAISAFRASTSDINDPRYWAGTSGATRQTTAGEQVGPGTALQLSAYFAALRAISEDLMKLPLVVQRQVGNRVEKLPDHPVSVMFRSRVCPDVSASAFRETTVAHCASWGNGYAEIVRNGAGQVAQLWPIHPSRVQPIRDDNGRLFYRVRSDLALRQPDAILGPAEMLHPHGLGGDGVTGYSVCGLAAESLGVALASQRFAAAFYGNGANVGGVLKSPGKLTDKAWQRLRESWSGVYQGPENAGKVAILEEGLDYSRTTIPPNEAQFLESRQFSIEEIARWFRMPPHKLQHLLRSTNNNIEHQSIEYVTDTLMPWAVRFEREIDAKILDGAGDLTIKHDFSALLRGDNNARANFYRTMVTLMIMTPNECRAAEGMNPGPPELDKFYGQGAMMPVEKLGQQAPAAPPQEDPEETKQEKPDAPAP